MQQILISGQHIQFDILASTWLSAGAETVSVWGDGQLVDRWPADAVLRTADLVAPIHIHNHSADETILGETILGETTLGEATLGEIRITGCKEKLTQLAATAVLAILFPDHEKELQQAGQVQSGYLPQAQPCLPGVDIFAESRPAHHVGGDYYDFILQPQDRLILTIGDVSGKGVSAAMPMAVMRKVIRTGAKLSVQSTPETILDYTYADMYQEFANVGMFATAFIGQYEPANRILSYVNAGHSPVMYRAANGHTRLLRADSVPVGIMPNSTCTTQKLRVASGDLLVIATDGFAESRGRAGQMFGYQRLLSLVDELASGTAQDIARKMFNTLSSFAAGAPRDDDQTLVVIKGIDC